MGHDATNVSWDPSGCCEDSSLEGAKEKQLRDDGGLDQGGGSGNNSDWLLSRCFFLQAEPTRFADELGEEYKSTREVKHDYRYLDEPLEGWRSHNQEGRIPGKPGGQFWAHQG